MSKQNKNQSHQEEDLGSVGSRIQAALTQPEISQLLNVLFAVLSNDLRDVALKQLPADTQETIKQILTPPLIIAQTQEVQPQPVSQAKLAQIWLGLWQEWEEIIVEAAAEEGEYILQEADWEPPYFDTYQFAENLDQVAQKMLPLVEIAFANRFNPDSGFTSALVLAESEIISGIPDWMDIDDGIYLEKHLTTCLLHWEWLRVKNAGEDAFNFAQSIRQQEENFEHITLDNDAISDFLSQLSNEEQKCILAGLNANRETALWQKPLDNIYSHWHDFYMTATQQYAPPEIYLNNLRATIGQQWQNGLPVIADLLAKQDFPASLAVIEETVDALLKSQHRGQSWQPETSLLFTIVDGSGNNHGHWQNEKTLLCYYQQTAAGLGQTERIQALKIQQIVFDSCFDWSVILETFTNIPIAVEIHQSLFSSWRDYVVRRAKPQSRWDLYTTVKTVDNWWLHWLINSAAASDLDATGFQAQILQWLTNLPENKGELGEAYDILRLLTKDLTEIYSQTQPPYPQFYQVVIRPRDMSSRDDTFRKKYLQQYAPNDLWDQVMAYWKTQLHNFVPRPELSRNSDYTEHAQWMSALKELAPKVYQNLLAQWRIEHQRRRNLWKAMEKLELC